MRSVFKRVRYSATRVASTAFAHAWCHTLRLRWQFPHDTGVPRLPSNESFLVALFHETLLLPAWGLAPFRPHALVSASGDGNVISQVLEAWGWRTIRGSSSKNGTAALRQILATARREKPFQLVITVDGPRGPRRVCKDGIIYLASHLGIPILPVGAAAHHKWRLKSWDRFVIPKPASRCVLSAGSFLHIPSDLTKDKIEPYRDTIVSAIEQAQADAEASLESPQQSQVLNVGARHAVS